MRFVMLSQMVVLLALAGCVSVVGQPAPERRTTYVAPPPPPPPGPAVVVPPPPPGSVVLPRP